MAQRLEAMDSTYDNFLANSAARIERVETLLLDVPMIRPHRLSVATMYSQTLMLVRVYTADGVIGLGEGTTIAGLAYGTESPEGMKLAIDRHIYFSKRAAGLSSACPD
jgi:muconate cycloisomerase